MSADFNERAEIAPGALHRVVMPYAARTVFLQHQSKKAFFLTWEDACGLPTRRSEVWRSGEMAMYAPRGSVAFEILNENVEMLFVNIGYGEAWND